MTEIPEAEIQDTWVTPWMIWTAINDPRLMRPRPPLRYFDGTAEKRFNSLTKAHGCDPLALYDTVAAVGLFQKCLPSIDQRALRRFAERLEGDLETMKTLVPSHTVMFAEDDFPTSEKTDGSIETEQKDEVNRRISYRLVGADKNVRGHGEPDVLVVNERISGSGEKKKVRYKLEGTAGDIHPSPRFRRELENMVEGYRELASFSLRHKDYLEHICELLPARWVHQQTGDPHFADIAALLDWACPLKKQGSVRDPDMLRRYYSRAAKCLPHLDTLLYLMRQTHFERAPLRTFSDSDEVISRPKTFGNDYHQVPT